MPLHSPAASLTATKTSLNCPVGGECSTCVACFVKGSHMVFSNLIVAFLAQQLCWGRDLTLADSFVVRVARPAWQDPKVLAQIHL